MTNNENIINAAKRSFEASFAENIFYNRQTRDQKHLDAILAFIPVSPGMKILDLGTGSGYLAFALAEKYRDISVTGLDIVTETLEKNRRSADNKGIDNIGFVSYDGSLFPFSDSEFDIVVSRYVLHHFPDIEKSVREVYRVLKKNGAFFISDPAPDDSDIGRFIDEYMSVKKDGHVKFYTLREWESICGSSGFRCEDLFGSTIRFPRKYEDAYRGIIEKHGKAVTELYDIKVAGDEIFITEQVNNILFRRPA